MHLNIFLHFCIWNSLIPQKYSTESRLCAGHRFWVAAFIELLLLEWEFRLHAILLKPVLCIPCICRWYWDQVWDTQRPLAGLLQADTRRQLVENNVLNMLLMFNNTEFSENCSTESKCTFSVNISWKRENILSEIMHTLMVCSFNLLGNIKRIPVWLKA